MNNDFDFMKYFSNFKQYTKADMINRYVLGKITKQQLDEFMKGVKDDNFKNI